MSTRIKTQFPGLRIGQILENALTYQSLFYVTDEGLARLLLEFESSLQK